jgi:hypothetical protein
MSDYRTRVLDGLKRSIAGELAAGAVVPGVERELAFDKSSTSSKSYHSKTGNPFSKSKFEDGPVAVAEEEAFLEFARELLKRTSRE